MTTDVKIILIAIYICAIFLSGLLFVLKRIAVIRFFNGNIKIDIIDAIILSIRLVCLSMLPVLNIIYILIHVFGWVDCIKVLKIDIEENDYRLT